MTPERWRQVTAVFHAALTHDASARASYLNQTCADDPVLRAEVEAMLAAHHEAGGFGDRPPSGFRAGSPPHSPVPTCQPLH
jgi:serine/threonine-protein kinase